MKLYLLELLLLEASARKMRSLADGLPVLICSCRAAYSVLIAGLALTGCHSGSQNANRKPSATNEYHGTQVVDDYQWLENAADPAVREWSAGQNQRTRLALDQLAARRWVEDRLTRLLTDASTNYYSLSWRAGRLFLLKFAPPAEQPVLITLGSLTNLASQRVILDPNQSSTSGTISIDWYVPSRDGKRVAVSLSENGSENGTLHVYDAESGQALSDRIPRVQGPTAGGSAAWNHDGTGLFYTRYPRPGEKPENELGFYQQIYFHRLGTPAEQDTYELGNGFPRIAEIELETSPDGRRILATVANGDGGEYAHYLRESSGRWHQITRFEDQISRAEFGREPLYIEWGKDDALYLLSHQGAPNGKILRLPLAQPDLTNAYTFFPAGTNVIHDFKPSASGLSVVFLNGGPSEFAFLDYFDNKIYSRPETTPSDVQEMLVTQGDEILFRSVSYTEPYTWWRYNPSRSRLLIEPTLLTGTSRTSFGDVEAVREMVRSKDGTEVPLNIIRKRGTRLHGGNPTLLTGYGGYGISMRPNFDASSRVWLDQGGLVAIANLRGGGEFGEEWHRSGSLTNKQNVFDDFVACAEFLIRSNYTRPEKLAIQGASNGGLLMGATLTQRPDLVQAVVSQVGIYDMLRVELDPNGAFNVTEFGTVKDPDQFKTLHAYSPFHRVANRTEYPAVLLLSGENDGRVNPAHSRKMIARLQAASSSPRPIFLRTSSSGHGIGTALSERIQQLADVYAFLFDQLGIDYSVIESGPWSGGVTPSSALVKAKLANEGMNARLVVSKSATFAKPIYLGPVRSETNHGNVVAFPIESLEPDTGYHYALEVDGRLDRGKAGEFRTFPAPGPASFRIVFASCARTGSTSEVFDRIRENQPLFYMNMGDFHYQNIQTNDRSRFRAAYDAVLASPQQADLYRHVPFVYIWDDHDFGGNNSNRRASSHEAARLTYDEYVPHYPLPLAFGRDEEGPICQTFAVGRVKFILTDLRSERDSVTNKDNAAKSLMGAKQKAWFKQQLLDANGRYPLICWVTSVPWIGRDGTNVYQAVKTNQFGYIHHTNLVATVRTNADTRSTTNSSRRGRVPSNQDHWSVFSTERREIADFIKANQIRGVCILHGDSHMLAADDGSHSDYATGGGVPIPVMCGGPLDQEPSLKGGPYSQGVYRVQKGEGGFGLLTVSDGGDRIDVSYSGRNHENKEKISLKFTVPASKAVAKK
jgi:prolyl oligopeptidase